MIDVQRTLTPVPDTVSKIIVSLDLKGVVQERLSSGLDMWAKNHGYTLEVYPGSQLTRSLLAALRAGDWSHVVFDGREQHLNCSSLQQRSDDCCLFSGRPGAWTGACLGWDEVAIGQLAAVHVQAAEAPICIIDPVSSASDSRVTACLAAVSMAHVVPAPLLLRQAQQDPVAALERVPPGAQVYLPTAALAMQVFALLDKLAYPADRWRFLIVDDGSAELAGSALQHARINLPALELGFAIGEALQSGGRLRRQLRPLGVEGGASLIAT